MSTRKTRGDSGWEWSFYCHPDNLTLCPCSKIRNGVWIMIMKASKWWERWPQAPLLSLRRSLMPVSAPLNGSRSMGSALAHSRPSPFPKRQRQTGSSELSGVIIPLFLPGAEPSCGRGRGEFVSQFLHFLWIWSGTEPDSFWEALNLLGGNSLDERGWKGRSQW